MAKNTESGKIGAAVVGELMSAAKESPDMKVAGANVAASLATVTGTIKTVLLPLAALNYGVEKAQTYFKEKFLQDLAEKAAKIPDERVVEPKASIAGPALQGLAFSHEEINLKEMYLELLASAMDSKTTNNAHPAFVEIIRQLTSEEASLLEFYLPQDGLFPIGAVRFIDPAGGYQPIYRHLIDISRPSGEIYVNPRLPSIIDNWIRLGLVEVDYSRSVKHDTAYTDLRKRPEFIALEKEWKVDGGSVMLKEGTMARTDFGIAFGHAVGFFG